MRRPILVTICCLGLWSHGVMADERIAYAPDVVGVDRIFMVALKTPLATPDVQVGVPDCVALFDRTRLPTQSDIRRFYFRAVKPTPKAEIRFALPGGDAVVPIEIWSFDDLRAFRTLKNTQLPRRWPLGQLLPELKEKQIFPTGAEQNAPASGKGGWLDTSDDDIWAMQPDSTIPRWHWVNIQYGCPTHGKEIYRVRAYYPWTPDATLPWKWKIRCPVGNEDYPSNDFAKGDMTGGEFPDDGIGGGCLCDGKRYGFIAETAQFYCRRMMTVAPACSRSYAATGDPRYVHKALVALSRLAVEYAYLATMTQHRHRNRVTQVERFGQGLFQEGPCLRGSGFTTYCIEQPGELWDHAEAYDRIFPAIDKDPEIIPFLQKKGFTVKSHEDVRRFIEENLFAVWMQGVMDGACSSNEPYEQRGLARTAEILNYAHGTDFMDWLYDGEGKMRVFVPNTFFRDGAPYESSGGYNGMHVSALGPIIESIEHLRKLRPEVYPEEKYPSLTKRLRYRNVFDFSMDTVTIDRWYPGIGDDGGYTTNHASHKKMPKRTWQNGGTEAFELAYKMFLDPKFAWALARDPAWRPSPDFPFSREQIEKEAAKWPDDWNDRSALKDGYGIAILRSGKGDLKRALWMMYGRYRSHCQDDIMDIGLQGYQGIFLSHLGYPRNWGYWEPSWTSHHLARQFPYQNMTAQAQLFADAGAVHVAEARAQNTVDHVDQGKGYELPPDDWQRRTVVLVDVGPDKFYCVDFYRISGGKEHWSAFHCQEGDFATNGIALTKQEGGTLAGPNVPYGDENWLKQQGCDNSVYGWRGPMFAFPHLYNVQQGRPEGVWSADWRLKTGEGLHVRLTMASSDGAEVNVCDGRSPAGGSPYEMKWIMLHKQGETPVRTQLLSIIEPYLETPLIQEVRPLRLSGEDESGFAAMGCVVRLADRTDTILASADPTVLRTAEGGITFAGRFGFYSEQNGRPIAVSLVGGTRLEKNGVGVSTEAPEYRAKIVTVDRDTETILVSPAPPQTEALLGAYVFITNPIRRIAYKVLAARIVAEGAELRLDMDSRIGCGRVTGVEDHKVKTSTPFPLHHFRYYLGARVTNADRTAEYRLVEVRDRQAALIDPALHPEAAAQRLATEFPKDSWFEVHDYGVGDEVVRPHVVSLAHGNPGYHLSASAPVKVGLPEGCRIEPPKTRP